MEELLTQLKLARIREVYQDWIDKASKEEMSYADFLKPAIWKMRLIDLFQFMGCKWLNR